MKTKFLIFIIFIFAISIRLVGINWDQGQHLHPDERFMTMVASSVSLPSSIANYFDSQHSLLSPYNNNYNFYAYGIFPLLLTRAIGQAFHFISYDSIYIVGRILSIFFDSLIVILIYKISQLIFKKLTISLLASFIYSSSFLPIQQSHFFTVDSFAVFFTVLFIYLFSLFISTSKKQYVYYSAIVFGLAISCKISILIILPFVLFFFVPKNIRHIPSFLIISFFSFRIFQPYAFENTVQFNPLFIQNISDAKKMITGDIDYPPNIQWSYTLPIVHPLINLFFYGYGIPSSLLFLFSFPLLKKYFSNKIFVFITIFAAIIFAYQSIQLAKYMRYFYPIYPVLSIFSALGLYFIASYFSKYSKLIISLSIILLLYWSLSFNSIFFQPHTRIQASQWIINNISPSSRLSAETWDDSLPLRLSTHNPNFQVINLNLYDQESLSKWQEIISRLNNIDYIILSSSRLSSSIPRLPQRYPISSVFYQKLFSQQLGFTQVANFSQHPCLLFTPICFSEKNAEESFSVYDHPQVYIFQKNDQFINLDFSWALNQDIINQAVLINPKLTNHF